MPARVAAGRSAPPTRRGTPPRFRIPAGHRARTRRCARRGAVGRRARCWRARAAWCRRREDRAPSSRCREPIALRSSPRSRGTSSVPRMSSSRSGNGSGRLGCVTRTTCAPSAASTRPVSGAAHVEPSTTTVPRARRRRRVGPAHDRRRGGRERTATAGASMHPPRRRPPRPRVPRGRHRGKPPSRRSPPTRSAGPGCTQPSAARSRSGGGSSPTEPGRAAANQRQAQRVAQLARRTARDRDARLSASRWRSFALELRGTLLEEGGDPLGTVARRGEQQVQVGLESMPVGHREIASAEHGFARGSFARGAPAARRSASSRAYSTCVAAHTAIPLRSSCGRVDLVTDDEHPQRERDTARPGEPLCATPTRQLTGADFGELPSSRARPRRERRPRARAPHRRRLRGRPTRQPSAPGTRRGAQQDRVRPRGVRTRGSAVPTPSLASSNSARGGSVARRVSCRNERRARGRTDVGQRAGFERDRGDARSTRPAHRSAAEVGELAHLGALARR